MRDVETSSETVAGAAWTVAASAGPVAPTAFRETWLTWANAVTLVRVLSGMTIFALAAHTGNQTLNFVGLGVYWILDIVDGALARGLKQETRLGAQLDILGDRVLVAFFYFNYLRWHPGSLVPCVLFLFQFMFVDHYLSQQFLRWPILSPNYFGKVDRTIYRLNWSPAAKAVNTGLTTVLLIATGWVVVTSIATVGMIGLKVYTCVRMSRLPAPEPFLRNASY